jgi:hypothetical protein
MMFQTVSRGAAAFALLVLGACAGFDTTTRTEPVPVCAAAASREMDFWLGAWDVSWINADGVSGHALSQVVLDADGCVLRERFEDATTNLAGVGIYTYFAPAGVWSHSWMDNHGIAVNAQGRVIPGEGFAFDYQRGADPNRRYRAVFEDIRPAGFIWRYQSRGEGEGAWRDETTSRYIRRSASAAQTGMFTAARNVARGRQ